MTKPQASDRFSPFQFIRNIGANLGIFVFNTLISFWFTPFLIKSLGNEAYGFIPLITSVVSYFAIITTSLNSATSRYLMIEIEQGNDEQANVIFNTMFVSLLALMALTIPISILLFAYLDLLFIVPADYLQAVRFLFICSVIAFELNTLRTTFSIASYTQNRFDLRGLFNFLGRTTQVIAVARLFIWKEPNLYWVGLGLVAAALVVLFGDVFLWRRLLPTLRLRPATFDGKIIKDIGSTSLWMLLITIGTLIFLNVEIILANRFLPLALAGIYGGLLAIPSNLRGIASTVNGVWGPLLLTKFSRDDLAGLARVSRSSVKLIGLSIALPVGFVAGASREFLGLWLGPEFATYAWVGAVMAIHLGMNFSTAPLSGIYVSMNRVRLPALATLMSGVISAVLGVVLVQLIGPMGLAIAAGVAFTLLNTIFVPIYTAQLLNKPWWFFFSGGIVNGALTLLVASITRVTITFVDANHWASFFLVGVAISAVYVLVAFFLGLSSIERDLLLKRGVAS